MTYLASSASSSRWSQTQIEKYKRYIQLLPKPVAEKPSAKQESLEQKTQSAVTSTFKSPCSAFSPVAVPFQIKRQPVFNRAHFREALVNKDWEALKKILKEREIDLKEEGIQPLIEAAVAKEDLVVILEALDFGCYTLFPLVLESKNPRLVKAILEQIPKRISLESNLFSFYRYLFDDLIHQDDLEIFSVSMEWIFSQIKDKDKKEKIAEKFINNIVSLTPIIETKIQGFQKFKGMLSILQRLNPEVYRRVCGDVQEEVTADLQADQN